MKERPALSASPYSYVVVIIGTLEQTPTGRWLQQSCSEPVKSGDYIWPNSVSLKEADANLTIKLMIPIDDMLTMVNKPPDEEIDPRDRGRIWAAAYGRIDSREDLAVAYCGDEGKLCGYGFGPISAPAELTYRKIRIFSGSPSEQ